MFYQTNPIIPNRLLGALTLAIWPADIDSEAEAEVARKTAIRLLIDIETPDLPELRNVLSQILTGPAKQLGASWRLREIYEIASNNNPVLPESVEVAAGALVTPRTAFIPPSSRSYASRRAAAPPRPEGARRYRRYRRNPSLVCSNCRTGNREGRDICWKCGFDLGATAGERLSRIRRRATPVGFRHRRFRRRNPAMMNSLDDMGLSYSYVKNPAMVDSLSDMGLSYSYVKNPAMVDSLSDMGLSYSYVKRIKNPDAQDRELERRAARGDLDAALALYYARLRKGLLPTLPKLGSADRLTVERPPSKEVRQLIEARFDIYHLHDSLVRTQRRLREDEIRMARSIARELGLEKHDIWENPFWALRDSTPEWPI